MKILSIKQLSKEWMQLTLNNGKIAYAQTSDVETKNGKNVIKNIVFTKPKIKEK